MSKYSVDSVQVDAARLKAGAEKALALYKTQLVKLRQETIRECFETEKVWSWLRFKFVPRFKSEDEAEAYLEKFRTDGPLYWDELGIRYLRRFYNEMMPLVNASADGRVTLSQKSADTLSYVEMTELES